MSKIDFKETIKKLKSIFENGLTDTQEPAAAGKEYSLIDGTKVMISALEVGGMVLVNGLPVPSGEYQLEDGTMLVIDDKGVILEVKKADAEQAPQAQPVNYSEQFNSINEKFSSYEIRFAAYEQRFQNAETTIGKQQQVITELIKLVEKLAETPSDNPMETPIQAFKSHIAEGKEKRIDAISAALKEIRTKK